MRLQQRLIMPGCISHRGANLDAVSVPQAQSTARLPMHWAIWCDTLILPDPFAGSRRGGRVGDETLGWHAALNDAVVVLRVDFIQYG